jgi:hypothetical protein
MKWQYLAALLIAYQTTREADYSALQRPLRNCVMAANNSLGASTPGQKRGRTKKPDQGRAF